MTTPAPTLIPRGRHLESIDQLRGIAILLVVMGHIFAYAGMEAKPPLSNGLGTASQTGYFIFSSIFCNGFLGVMLFFVLSGFCIRWSHLHSTSFSLRGFYLRRAFRIYPAYLVWLGVFSILTAPAWWDIGLHLLLAHNLHPRTFLSINGPFWTIALEWQIYLLYPLILWVAGKLPSRVVLIGTALWGVLSFSLGTSFIQNLLHPPPLVMTVSRLPFALLFPWMLGFYQAERSFREPTRQPGWAAILAALAVGVLMQSHLKASALLVLPWSLFSFLLLRLFCASPPFTRSKALRPLAFIGIISYSIYLGHDIMARYYGGFESWAGLSRGLFPSALVAATILIPVAALIGWVSFIAVEKPGMLAGSHLRKRLGW